MTEAGSYSFDENNFKIFDNMLEGVSVYEPVYADNGKIIDFIIKYVNPATVASSDDSLDYYIGKRVSELYGFENMELHFKIAEEIMATGKSKTFKAFLPPLNGYFQVSGFLTNGFFVMLRVDITDQENAEKELQKSYKDLEIKVKERTHELQNANEKLKKEIEERKKAEEKLKESEEKFRELFNKANDMISLSEVNEDGMPGKYIEVNEVGCKRLGYTKEELLDMSPSDIVAPEKRGDMSKNASLIVENGYNNFEIVHIAKNGQKIPVEINGHTINYKGRKAYLTISRDIRNRKLMEESLKESEEKFRLIFNKADDMIALTELDEKGIPGNFIEVNEAGFKRLGYTKEELLNMGPKDIIDPEKFNIKSNAKKLSKNEQDTFESAQVTKDGKKIPIEINAHNFKIKGKNVGIGISRDITERKQMEEALRESEEKFREIFNNANDMITLHVMNENGMPGNFIEVNNVGCERLDYTSEEFQNMSPISIVAPDKRVEMANHAIRLWTNGYAKFETIHIAKNGRRVPVEVNTHLFKLKGKKVALGISRDITERKNAEEKLNEVLSELSQFNESFEQHTYLTAHYIQDYLGNIIDLTKKLKQNHKSQLDHDIEEFMEHITDESVNLKQLILNLLEYAKISKVNKSLKPVDIEESLNKALYNLKINDNNIEITYDNLPKVVADPDQIIKVFQNLIINALEFKKEDEKLKIHISARKDEKSGEYVFGVHDNGIGIDSQCTGRIFEIYYHLSAQGGYNVTGIGLSIAQKVIEGHGGRIWVGSEPGMGSVFYFSLPATP